MLSGRAREVPFSERQPQLVKKGFDKLVDGEASSPARCRASNLRFEPSAVSPRAKPENPKGFQPPYHPHQFLLKSKRFPGAKTARKRFLLWKMRFSGAKIVPCPSYTPLGTIKSSRGFRPFRALRGFFRIPEAFAGQCGGRRFPKGGARAFENRVCGEQ